MPRHQCKNTINNRHYVSTGAQQPHTTVGPERCNAAEIQDKDFKAAIINMLNDLKEDMNKSINKVYENTYSGMK